MYTAACETSHGLVALLFKLPRIVGDPALHGQASLGAAVKECCHDLIAKSGRDRNRSGA